MHPAFVTAIAAAQQQDKLARATASRRAREARPARHGAQPARRGSQSEPRPRHAIRRPHRLAALRSPARQKAGA